MQWNILDLIQAMAEQGHILYLSSKLNLIISVTIKS